jgi:hypothetical protein
MEVSYRCPCPTPFRLFSLCIDEELLRKMRLMETACYELSGVWTQLAERDFFLAATAEPVDQGVEVIRDWTQGRQLWRAHTPLMSAISAATAAASTGTRSA